MTWMPKPPDFGDLLRNSLANSSAEDLVRLTSVGPLTNGQYRGWDKVQYLPAPMGMTPHEHWLGLKLARNQLYDTLPMIGIDGNPFHIALYPGLRKLLHQVDMKAGGALASSERFDRSELDLVLVRSLEEEGITSSQLEGASTTRRVAKEMLRSGRDPGSKSERMILNNVLAMELARDARKELLTPELVRRIHAVVTQETLPAKESGLYRTDDDKVRIYDERGETLFVPPDAREIEERIERLCTFANRPDESDPFVHPVVQSILLHFWLAYIHPFVDGNGRTARILFYWSMLRHGYWLAEYLSISKALRRAPGEYIRSFLRTESDDNDVTYFVDHQLHLLVGAIGDLHGYIDRKREENRRVRRFLEREQAKSDGLNGRQLGLMRHAVGHANYLYTIVEHQQLHGIVYETARTDLMGLVERDLMVSEKVGRAFRFRVPKDLTDRIANEEF